MKTIHRIRKRIIPFLILVLLLSVGGVLPSSVPGIALALEKDTSDGYYKISSFEDLIEMKNMIINSGNTGADTAKFKLTRSFSCGSQAVSSGAAYGYGRADSSVFKGIFDGKGYTISDLEITGAGDNIGLFRVTEGATIRNLTMNNCTLNIKSDTSSSSGYGLVAGSMTGGTVSNVTIRNCKVEDVMQGLPGSNSITFNNVGVVAGSTSGTTMTDITLAGNTVSIDDSHKGTNIGDATSTSGNDPTAGQNTNPDPATTATPTVTATPTPTTAPSSTPTILPTTAPTAAPTAAPTVTPEPTSAPPKKGEIIRQGDAEFKVLGNGSVGYAASTSVTSSAVIIPDTIIGADGTEYRVTRILENAFNGHSELKTVVFGRYIEVVEDSAFLNCTSLVEITSSPVLRIIGKKAFFNCKKLKHVRLPKTIVKIGTRAFKNCRSLRSFILGDKSLNKSKSVEKCYRKGGFTADELCTLSQALKGDAIHITIGAEVFQNCQNLQRVVINVQVRVIGNSAFSKCTSLSAIVVYSKQLQTVGGQALHGVHDCRISVYKVKLKVYKKLFKNKGQGKKVIVAKM